MPSLLSKLIAYIVETFYSAAKNLSMEKQYFVYGVNSSFLFIWDKNDVYV